MTEKLFYTDSHLKEFEAQVCSCQAAGEDGRFLTELDRTAFFPEGGGQYADTGKLGGVNVLDVQEKAGKIFHVTDGFLEPGSRVKGCIDWEERFMKMQQHTGEHIVSGLVKKRFGYNNVGFHLGSTDCTMDFSGEISREELREIEAEANRAVWKNLDVQVLYPSQEELEKIEYRSKIEIEGQVRIVVVPGYDVCACCAPHVKCTGEIGIIKLTNVQRYKGGVRVTMLCGVRAYEDYSVKQDEAGKISAMLCAKENETAEAVERLCKECEELKSSLAGRERELAVLTAAAVPEEEQAVCVFTEILKGDSLRTVMNFVLEKERKICAVFSGNDREGYRYVIGSRCQDMRAFAKEFNAAFEGRGGGKPEMVQGTVKGSADEMRAWIQEKAGAV